MPRSIYSTAKKFAARFTWLKIFNQRSWVSSVVFFGVLANLPFWLASLWLGIWCHGTFCIEYILVGLLVLFLPRPVARPAAALLLLITICADLISGVSETYFLSPSECLTSFVFLPEFSGHRFAAIAAVLVLTLFIIAIAAFTPVATLRGTNRRRAAACLIAFGAAMLLTDYTTLVRGTGHIINPLRANTHGDGVHPIYFRGLRLARPITLRIIRNEVLYDTIRNDARAGLPDQSPVPSAASIALNAAGIFSLNSTHPNVVLVLVESWGLNSNPALRDLLVRDDFQPAVLARYQVLQGSVPFFGSTVAGESRELCGTRINMHILNATDAELADCIPRRLASLGYRNIAIHGMDGHMFNRLDWYPRIGFNNMLFRNNFRKAGLPDCIGAFTATCDANIANQIKLHLSANNLLSTKHLLSFSGQLNLLGLQPPPDFIYWVTVNSHLPVPSPVSFPGAPPCDAYTQQAPQLRQQPALCAWFQLVSNVHRSVADIALSNLNRPTIFVLVGDHTPPFVDPNLRNQFSSEAVPYIILVPRNLGPHSVSAPTH